YELSEIATVCGLMARQCIRNEDLANIMLQSEQLYDFFEYVESPTFDVASDAFQTFRDLMASRRGICADFLERNYDRFFEQYQNLLTSKNYVVRRRSIRLLADLLLDSHNFSVMQRYTSNADNLKLVMNALKDKSPSIQFEAFHVFKVFVANPQKTPAITELLVRNRVKLAEFLSALNVERTDQEQFNDEKAYLIKQIHEMKSA
ncbi:calcium-binding protein 39-like isoform 3, partial [Aphelenchoides avenae]